jgi:hypothetical protein
MPTNFFEFHELEQDPNHQKLDEISQIIKANSRQFVSISEICVNQFVSIN